jgi:hypothetical protein
VLAAIRVEDRANGAVRHRKRQALCENFHKRDLAQVRLDVGQGFGTRAPFPGRQLLVEVTGGAAGVWRSAEDRATALSFRGRTARVHRRPEAPRTF